MGKKLLQEKADDDSWLALKLTDYQNEKYKFVHAHKGMEVKAT
jgi:hypothetical protein